MPLINSPKINFSQLQKSTPTLTSPETDITLAKKEFRESPLYSNHLVSQDGKTTALQVIFKRDETYQNLLEKREDLREKRLLKTLTVQESRDLDEVSVQFKHYSDALLNQAQADIAAIRKVLFKHRNNAEIHLGGIPMIVSDIIDYVEHDIQVFGLGVLLFLVILLTVFFRKPRWVVLPMIICSVAALSMIGILGLMEWRVTVVSSNFISLLLITTLSLTVHLIVRYQELHSENPEMQQKFLLWETLRSKAQPAFFTAITTMVAFASLLVSGIRPVIDFGWMMVFGVALAFVFSFLMFPSMLMFLTPGQARSQHDFTSAITALFARLIHRNGNIVLITYVLLMILSLVGIASLTVENRFIDYFKESTEIYQGMIMIDRELGGTTPLDVILEPDKSYYEFINELGDESFSDDESADDESAGISGTSYWFNVFQLETVDQIHKHLEQLPETGKVLSMATTMKLLTQLNNDEPLDNISLAVMYKRLPESVKQTLFDPYMSNDGNQLRFAIRVYESDVTLQRQALIDKIRADLSEKFDLEKEQINLTGMLVLYNNMLQSLFQSQMLTIGVVFMAIMLMFMVLFRSVKISVIAIIPNLAAAAFVLGLMGWLGIHLDIMTITIAAITIGIAVDDTIHYVHRFMEEYPKDHDYWATVNRCHASIGKAMYYTSVTITLGFSILALSNFIPTIYFGLLTGVAMVVALIANLTLLPLLLVKFKPLKH
ncbi:MAG: MMPL family transporter [Gammaproteobacteria bacterium]|nr:MMPL family transporter [Gammaproteobacteria bacterium]MCF6261291.1 MMPL family transporter [Gammaproteobacteria bacterium]